MTERDRQILTDFANAVVPQIQNLSSSFAPSINYEINEKITGFEFLITGAPYMSVLVDGRKPTGTGAKKGAPTLQQIILAWIERKGITPKASDNGKVPTTTQLSWMISKSIHKKGTLLYQRGGGNNVFDTIFTQQRIDSLVDLLTESKFAEIESEVLREFNFND